MAELKDIKIDNIINQNVNKVLNNVILKKTNFKIKYTLKILLMKHLRIILDKSFF